MRRAHVGLLAAGCVVVLAGLLSPDALAQQRTTAKPQPQTMMERARSTVAGAWNNTRAFFGRLVDFGEAAIDWTKKKWTNSAVVKSLYGFLRGNPVIQWISRRGQQVVRRLEGSAARMVGTPRPTAAVPAFLKRLADWRARRNAGRR